MGGAHGRRDARGGQDLQGHVIPRGRCWSWCRSRGKRPVASDIRIAGAGHVDGAAASDCVTFLTDVSGLVEKAERDPGEGKSLELHRREESFKHSLLRCGKTRSCPRAASV
ncbi:hypothetical protein chiPu_0009767 [Chiloscyllium punctatum]|uniref:Uncharacterized protein n=1 Tax=Chiloscyllium punctatum TaxID=137246 RepID=A0A401SLP2_CHIPU|nr:hypothetical protein [Chiloscyllium punctatum]